MSSVESAFPSESHGRHDGGDVPPSIVEHCIALLRRRWKVAVGVWLVVMAAAVVVLWRLPREYESTARFLVKNARQDLVVGPNEQSATVYRDHVPEEDLNTELELLRSRDILAQVVGELKLDAGHLNRGLDPALAMELAIRELGGGLVAETLRKTNLIQVSYTSQDPRLANTILEKLADNYLAAHLAIHATPGSVELFRAQSEQVNQELRTAQEALAAIAAPTNLVMPDEQIKEVIGSLGDTQIQYNAVRAELRDAVARVRAAEQKMQEVPRRLQMQVRTMPNQYSSERLNTMLVELRNKRTQLLTKFTPDDRLIAEVNQQIADTEVALGDARNLTADEETSNINPVWQEMQSESLKAQLQVAGLSDRANGLREAISHYEQRAVQLTTDGPRYQALARNVTQLTAKYDLLVKKEEEARIAATLDQGRISNVVLAQAPFVAAVPSKPNVRVGLVIGASIASVLAACAVIASEHLSSMVAYGRRRRTPAEVTPDGASEPVTALS